VTAKPNHTSDSGSVREDASSAEGDAGVVNRPEPAAPRLARRARAFESARFLDPDPLYVPEDEPDSTHSLLSWIGEALRKLVKW
jgi:hypothetical protein